MPIELSQSVSEQVKALGIFLLVGIAVGIINVVIKVIKTRYALKLWSGYLVDFLRVVIDGACFALSSNVFFDFNIQAFHVFTYVATATLTYKLIYLILIPTLKKYLYTKRSK